MGEQKNPSEVIAAAWDTWLESKDHQYRCIGCSEGQVCCAEPVPDDVDELDLLYGGSQAHLIALALTALTDAGYEVRKVS